MDVKKIGRITTSAKARIPPPNLTPAVQLSVEVEVDARLPDALMTAYAVGELNKRGLLARDRHRAVGTRRAQDALGGVSKRSRGRPATPPRIRFTNKVLLGAPTHSRDSSGGCPDAGPGIG